MNSNTISIKYQTDYEIAPCMREGQLAENAQVFVSAARNLGDAPYASVIRAWCVPYLFHAMENLLASGSDPIKGVNSSLKVLTEFLSTTQKSGFDLIVNGVNSENTNEESQNVESVTGNHYGNLFKLFSTLSYWDEPVKLLKQRLERNGISVADVEKQKTLDAGCGGGRYSVAWRLLGAFPVTGLDIIEDANRRVREAKIDDISFQEGNVLELPFDDEEFDIVFSNGVLHHTTDWKKGVKELIRVMKTGGLGWLYLIENPGGVFWDVIEILRLVMKDEEKDTARTALKLLKMPANRIFYMLDHVMVPINLKLTPEEIENCLKEAGAINIKRLERGANFDRVEHIYQKKEFAKENFGVGENRYVFSK